MQQNIEEGYEVQILRGEGAGGEIWERVTELGGRDLAEHVRAELEADGMEARVLSLGEVMASLNSFSETSYRRAE